MIKCAKPIKVNKNSYIKPGSHIAKTGEEDPLFENMFELQPYVGYPAVQNRVYVLG